MSTSASRSCHPQTMPISSRGLQSEEEVLAYLKLIPRQVFAVAYALLAQCRRVGSPTTELQHEVAGLRDFLFSLPDDHHVHTLLQSI